MTWKSKTRKMFSKKTLITLLCLGLVAIFFVELPSLSTLYLSSQSYSTAYEGAKAQYYGVYDSNTGTKYSRTQKDGSSMTRFDTTMKFDKDEWNKNYCNLIGETTAIQIPMGDNKWIPPEWVPRQWWSDAVSWENPSETYEWQIKEGEYTTQFRMEEWKTKWFISIGAEPDTGPDAIAGDDESGGPRYTGMEVWFEIDTKPVWYFKGQTKAYFAIAKIELSSISIERKEQSMIKVVPESPGSILTIYQNPFGTQKAPTEDSLKSFYYQETQLNPQYFRDSVYTHIDLTNFGMREWWAPVWPFLSNQGDVVTMGFTVTQFVVGVWKVKDIGDIPDDYGRNSYRSPDPWATFWGDVAAAFGNPVNQLWLFFILIVAVIVIVTIANPGMWTAVIGIYKTNGGGTKK